MLFSVVFKSSNSKFSSAMLGFIRFLSLFGAAKGLSAAEALAGIAIEIEKALLSVEYALIS